MTRRVLILSGPTHEYFDPVRFVGNASSGLMGRALAEEALKRGMDVDFITGPVCAANLPRSRSSLRALFGRSGEGRLTIRKVVSASDMLAAAREIFPEADLVLFAAAVADFRPAERSSEKIFRTKERLSVELEPTPDLAASLCAGKRSDQAAVGFALQTHDGEARAREKRISKNLDAIVLNTPATLGAADGQFTWIDEHTADPWGKIAKPVCARRIFDHVRI